MLFSIDVLRARKGDCLLLHYGTKSKPRLAMIDGGPSGVYKPHLKPRLRKIRTARGLDDQDPLPVDVLMVSHVDDDHIKGILELTTEHRDLRGAQAPDLVDVTTLWHNAFDDLLDTTPGELAKVAAGFGAAAVDHKIDVGNGDSYDAAMVLASIPQGRDLRLDAEFLNWKVNRKFGGKLILATDESKPVSLGGGVKMTVVGPMKPELVALQNKHDEWLRKNAAKTADSSAGVPAAYVDRSVPNLSSLVFLAEAGGKSMLLAGDARGDKIIKGLQLIGRLAPGSKSKMHVDLLKVPHHGSANNLKKSFFQRIAADHYVFSGNGEHGNPERETFEMLFAARGNAPFTIHLTYPIDEIDAERKENWKKARQRELKRRAKKRTVAEKKTVKVRAAWSQTKHSLAGFLKKTPLKVGQTIRIVDHKAGHVIDLGDPLNEAWPTLA